MQPTTKIRFLKGGAVRKIHDHRDRLWLPGSKPQRVSHIEPVNFWLRILFHVIRYCVSDESRTADFTRRWKCLWQARIFNKLVTEEPVILGPFVSRGTAIAAEILWIESYWIGFKAQGATTQRFSCDKPNVTATPKQELSSAEYVQYDDDPRLLQDRDGNSIYTPKTIQLTTGMPVEVEHGTGTVTGQDIADGKILEWRWGVKVTQARNAEYESRVALYRDRILHYHAEDIKPQPEVFQIETRTTIQSG